MLNSYDSSMVIRRVSEKLGGYCFAIVVALTVDDFGGLW
jgi:hypothetical protein